MERFWSKVGRGEGCWEWGAGHNAYGYGVFNLEGRTVVAHRVAWMLTNGDPGEACVLHRCDNRNCVRPAHLFLGSRGDNVKDAMSKRRHVHGTSVPQAKLTPEKVREIRAAFAGGVKQAELARRYGVAPSAISRAVRGQSWRAVTAG